MELFGSTYEFTLGNPVTAWTLGIGLFVLVLMAAFSFLAYRAKGRGFWLLPTAARFLAVALLATCISQPTLKSTRTVVQRGRVIVFADVSRSMSLPDMQDGRTRHESACRLLFGPDEDLLDDLSRKFEVELIGFDDGLRRAKPDDPKSLPQPEGPATRIAKALRDTATHGGSVPLAACIVLSDGQDNGAQDVSEAAQACGVPVYTVGLGSRKQGEIKDLALVDLKVEKTVLMGSTVVAELALTSRGISANAPITLSCGGKKLATSLATAEPGSRETVRLQFVPREVGQFVYTISTPVMDEELTGENNRASFTVEVIDRTFNILFIEGMMRWEYKFLRRALVHDEDVNLESYLRVGQGRFFHQRSGRQFAAEAGPTGPSHRRGIPLTLAELEDFNLVIFGDLAAAHFSKEQLQAIAEFVSEKGGAFLMLGGKSTFAAGDYAGTPLERIMPVAIRPEGDLQMEGTFRPVVTPEGAGHPILTLDPDPARNSALWAGLPTLSGCNRTGPAKPGASVLMVRRSARRIRAPEVILAVQRYGKGKTASLAVDTTWHWDFESIGRGGDSTAYRQFYAQLVRWLMPDPDTDPLDQKAVRVTSDKTDYRQTETVRMEARVLDDAGSPASGAEIQGTLTDPDGGTAPVSFSSSDTPGVYPAVYVPRKPGVYDISVQGFLDGKRLGTDSAQFLVGEATQELEHTDLNEELLHAVADISGGQYHTPATAGKIPSSIPEMKKETIKTQRLRLWNSPLLLAAFLLFATVEWLIRRYAVGS